ncbi:DUF3592 domain-containing protein [Nocardiopsis ansamitocini]|uniref:DUF3592 domain-containing protein n=1 Tax=Nocardiopsis ansamitocini TaxID=1670832 RepID=A0A9W6PA79_9ACTN|nr:DUF3592 domain-containing protein [Nocardiopsis ansamitocini]GLU49821.1 hypothetical protein Nans01_41720 [Nocardiopsis ansamitocini]
MVLLLIGGVFALVGMALAVVGTVVRRREKHFARVGIAVPGRVIDIVRSTSTRRDSDGHRRTHVYFHPVVAYRAANGWEYRERSAGGTATPNYGIGQPVQVLHLPDDPAKFRIAGDRSGVLVVWILCGMGVLFALLGCGLLIGGLLSRLG